MEQRIDYKQAAPGALGAMLGLERYVRESGLEHPLLELVKLRASQVNGCAYCVDMHTKDARAAGESEQRLYAVSVWREAPVLFRARAGGARLDRGADAGQREGCAGRPLCRGARALL